MTDLCVCGHPKDSHCFCISTCNGLGVCGRCRYGPSRGPHVRCLEFRPAPQPHPEPEGVESRQAMCDEVKPYGVDDIVPVDINGYALCDRDRLNETVSALCRAEAKVEKLKALLKKHEWCWDGECIHCGKDYADEPRDQHKPGCEFAEALK